MLNIYSSFICRTCKKEFVLLSEEVAVQLKLNRYLVCPYCSSQNIKKQRVSDNLKECMSARSYKRVKGALREK